MATIHDYPGGRRCSGQWPGLAGAFLVLLYFVASPGQSGPFSVAGAKPKRACVQLCDMKMDGQLDLYQMEV